MEERNWISEGGVRRPSRVRPSCALLSPVSSADFSVLFYLHSQCKFFGKDHNYSYANKIDRARSGFLITKYTTVTITLIV